jgi:hypothetical protein
VKPGGSAAAPRRPEERLRRELVDEALVHLARELARTGGADGRGGVRGGAAGDDERARREELRDAARRSSATDSLSLGHASTQLALQRNASVRAAPGGRGRVRRPEPAHVHRVRRPLERGARAERLELVVRAEGDEALPASPCRAGRARR